jgi:hypothetical protein
MNRQVCHAAALALVGWYLMVPPVSSPGKLNETAPLSKWSQDSAYDTAANCEQYRMTMALTSGQFAAVFSKDERASATAKFNEDRFLDGHCVATEDPRLKGN